MICTIAGYQTGVKSSLGEDGGNKMPEPTTDFSLYVVPGMSGWPIPPSKAKRQQ